MTDIETMAAQARAKLLHSVHTKAGIAKRAISDHAAAIRELRARAETERRIRALLFPDARP